MKTERLRVIVLGAVQGVGFRPFVYRLAADLGLRGWVLNSSQGVFIEVEGARPALDEFLPRLHQEKPPRAFIQSMEAVFLEPAGYEGFEIRHEAEPSRAKTALILPDIATCPDCLGEIADPANRRYRYPFTNCTNCGPRFSIIEALPYDRPNTSMKRFKMCADCEKEYLDPRDRRFHAQPIACPVCGPQLSLWDESGRALARGHDALLAAAEGLRRGRILALKGIGGFQLLLDARDDAAVRRLRTRKHREEKPFALMYPSLEVIRRDCVVSAQEERLLASPEAPIVLLRARVDCHPSSEGPSQSVAPHNPNLGVMLPYSPLHHLLMGETGFALVATSGNISDEPICIDEMEARERLQGVADMFLAHDRPIARHVDDSIARIILGREQVLRRARGYAPLPVHVKESLPAILAVGAHLKNTVALSIGREVFISQHIGDLETAAAYDAFRRVAADLPRLYDVHPEVIACDLHPEYLSTKFAIEATGARKTREPLDRDKREALPARFEVQHHYAHVLACMAENEIEPPVLGVSWDGTGLGPDGTIWGGEFLLVGERSFQRAGHLRSFRLPGGEAAIKEPRRCALGALFETFGEKLFEEPEKIKVQDFSQTELPLLRRMLSRGVNAPLTTSAGRLFDVVASLAGLRQRAAFEGQAAMELEFAISPGIEDAYPFALDAASTLVVDWRPALRAILGDVRDKQPVGVISAKFHNMLASAVLVVAQRIGERNVVLTGGCFQNRYLTERCALLLDSEGFRPAWHQRVPPNDGGLALGQVMAAARDRGKTARASAPETAEEVPA